MSILTPVCSICGDPVENLHHAAFGASLTSYIGGDQGKPSHGLIAHQECVDDLDSDGIPPEETRRHGIQPVPQPTSEDDDAD